RGMGARPPRDGGAAGRPEPVLTGHEPEQAEPHVESQTPPGPGERAEARGVLRPRRGELPAGGHGPAGGRLRGTPGRESLDRVRDGDRLRPGRAVRRPAGTGPVDLVDVGTGRVRRPAGGSPDA